MRRLRSIRLRSRVLALDALFLCFGVLAAAIVLAWRVVPLPTSSPHPDAVRIATEAAGEVASTPHVVKATVDAGPFRPDRTRPPVRYRLASAAAPAPTVAASRRFVPAVRLQGIAMLPRGGGMAALSVQGQPAQIVRQGQMFEGLRLLRVRPDAATLVGPDTTIVLQLPGAARQP